MAQVMPDFATEPSDSLITYHDLMMRIKNRLDIIDQIETSNNQGFVAAETVAFHLRKIVEGVAFACLVAVKNGLKRVPREAEGQWNAEKIFLRLSRADIPVLPNPSVIRDATDAEKAEHSAGYVVEGQPEKSLSHEELITIYRRLHLWLHEKNPYRPTGSGSDRQREVLYEDVRKIREMLWKHFISIGGQAFYCVLQDDKDGQLKVIEASKAAV